MLSNKVTIQIWIGFCWCNHWWNDQNDILICLGIPLITRWRLYLGQQSILVLSVENVLHSNDSCLICGYGRRKNHELDRSWFLERCIHWNMWDRVSGSNWDGYFSNLVLFLEDIWLQSIDLLLKLLFCIIIFLLDLLVPTLNYHFLPRVVLWNEFSSLRCYFNNLDYYLFVCQRRSTKYCIRQLYLI